MTQIIKKIAQSIAVVALFFFLTGCDSVGDGTISLTTGSGTYKYKVDIAATSSERAQGLMFVQQMDDNKGMLFDFISPREVAFWMRNTFIPLDMIFIDSFGVVKAIHENAVPHDATSIPSNVPVQFVLELNAGQVKKIGLMVGDKARHKRFAKP